MTQSLFRYAVPSRDSDPVYEDPVTERDVAALLEEDEAEGWDEEWVTNERSNAGC